MKKKAISVGDWVSFEDLFGVPSIGCVFEVESECANVLYYDEDGDLTEWNFPVFRLVKVKKIRHLHYIKVGNLNSFIDTKKKFLQVGCQKIPFTEVQLIAETVYQLSKK